MTVFVFSGQKYVPLFNFLQQALKCFRNKKIVFALVSASTEMSRYTLNMKIFKLYITQTIAPGQFIIIFKVNS